MTFLAVWSLPDCLNLNSERGIGFAGTDDLVMDVSNNKLTGIAKMVAIHPPFVFVSVIREFGPPSGSLQANSHEANAGEEFREGHGD